MTAPPGDIDIDGLTDTDPKIPDFEVESLARCLLPKIQAYFDSPEGQAAFKEWEKQKSENI